MKVASMKEIAICISGLSRCTHQTWKHIHDFMVRPVEMHSDVYIAVSNVTQQMSIFHPVYTKEVASESQWCGFKQCHAQISHAEHTSTQIRNDTNM